MSYSDLFQCSASFPLEEMTDVGYKAATLALTEGGDRAAKAPCLIERRKARERYQTSCGSRSSNGNVFGILGSMAQVPRYVSIGRRVLLVAQASQMLTWTKMKANIMMV